MHVGSLTSTLLVPTGNFLSTVKHDRVGELNRAQDPGGRSPDPSTTEDFASESPESDPAPRHQLPLSLSFGGPGLFGDLWGPTLLDPSPLPISIFLASHATCHAVTAEGAGLGAVKMGGNPWHSKGCLSCRKRKVKCDKQEPECARCMKRGIPCPGYENNRIFLHQTSIQPEKSANLDNQVNQGRQQPQENQHGRASQLQYLSRARPVVLPQTVPSAPEKRDQLFAAYLTTYFPVEVVDSWHFLISGLAQLPQKPRCWKRPWQPSLASIWGSAIRSMSNMIHREIYHDDIVYCGIMFQELEAYYCPDGLQAWLAHVAGTEALIRKYRYNASTNPLMRIVYNKFQKLRIMFSMAAMNMTAEEYECVMQPGDDGPLDELIRLYADFSSLFIALQDAGRSNYETRQAVLHRCLAHRDRVLEWYERSKDVIGGPPLLFSPAEPLHSSLHSTDALFGPAYRFVSLEHARLHIVFWTALSTLHPLISQAQSLVRPGDHGHGPVNVDLEEDYRLAEFYADQMCRALPYCLQGKMRSCGAQMMVWATSHITKTYTDLQRLEKFYWCQDAFRRIAMLGFDSAARLREMLLHRWTLSRASCPDLRFSSIPQYVSNTPGFALSLAENNQSPSEALNPRPTRTVMEIG
ncbi:hypothetical protein N7462_006782 [Penicillium macrosclerotiorum]|uniref:uncharacterized protein n=1 Tax=Penicillium macrosclerotiorum TaxID=303699 RepID=UPI00254666B7|nr:uncharacterized protein N7462_006782 [Penicillium macrosclerotiorum]KAJ5683617.1 hypothetical protein N7462_006782 [Penicillium macrosclerotiorum]